MPDLEKTIEGLEDFIECYKQTFNDDGYAPLEDALSMLKAQQPSVITLEENQISIVSPSLVAFSWVEEKNRNDIYIALVTDYRHFSDIPRAMRITRFHGNGIAVSGEDYGKTWRCWTYRPSDEQREATPWQ